MTLSNPSFRKKAPRSFSYLPCRFVAVFFRAGDGTTTSTLLTQEIVNQGMRLVTSGANPVELRQGILAASGMIIEEIKKLATPIRSNQVRWSTVFRTLFWFMY